MRKIQKWTKRAHKKKAPKRSFLLPPVPRHLSFPRVLCLPLLSKPQAFASSTASAEYAKR